MNTFMIALSVIDVGLIFACCCLSQRAGHVALPETGGADNQGSNEGDTK